MSLLKLNQAIAQGLSDYQKRKALEDRTPFVVVKTKGWGKGNFKYQITHLGVLGAYRYGKEKRQIDSGSLCKTTMTEL